jgi:hypothetical protein
MSRPYKCLHDSSGRCSPTLRDGTRHANHPGGYGDAGHQELQGCGVRLSRGRGETIQAAPEREPAPPSALAAAWITPSHGIERMWVMDHLGLVPHH